MKIPTTLALLGAAALLGGGACSDSASSNMPDMVLADPRCAPLPMCGKSCSVDSECVVAGDVGQCVRVAAGKFCVPSCAIGKVSCPAGYECRASNESSRCLKPCTSDNDCTESRSACCDGSCVDLSSDRKNCNKCGTVCPTTPNAVPVCESGACGIGRCSTGFANCDFDDANGCEADVSRDVKNCGGCELMCETPAGGEATCADSKCGISCLPTRGNCNGDTRDGCETDLQTDSSNCGACNIVCQNPAACRAGKCS